MPLLCSFILTLVITGITIKQPRYPVLNGSSNEQPHLINFKTSEGSSLVPGGGVTGTKDCDMSPFCHPFEVGPRFGGQHISVGLFLKFRPQGPNNTPLSFGM